MEIIEKFAPSGLLTDNAASLFIEVDGKTAEIQEQIEQIQNICAVYNSAEIEVAVVNEPSANLQVMVSPVVSNFK